MSDNGTFEALAGLIKAANLSPEQARELGVIAKRNAPRPKAKRRPRSGPHFHAKPGSVVQVRCPDGVILEMNVYKSGSTSLRLTTRSIEVINKMAEMHRQAIIRQFNIKPKDTRGPFPALKPRLEQSGQVERLA